MPLKIHRFDVYLWPEGTDPADYDDTEPECYKVRCLHIDQLMGERAYRSTGGDMASEPMGITTAWVYAAVQRLGLYPKDKPLAVFMHTDLAGIQRPEEEAEVADVDPTRPTPESG